MIVDIVIGRFNPSPIGSIALVEPLISNKKYFREYGIEIRSVSYGLKPRVGADLVVVDSKTLKPYWASAPERALKFLTDLKVGNGRVFFFDTSDSTGSIQDQVFPFVDRYLKSHLLRDKNIYRKPLYGERVYTDFFNKKYGVRDEHELWSQPLTEDKISKLGKSWSTGLAGGFGKRLSMVHRRLPYYVLGIGSFRKNRFVSVAGRRDIDLLIRMSTDQNRRTIAWQRDRVQAQLGEFLQPTALVGVKQYLQEMSSSKLVVAPFAWGEMNVRDFESFALGALLVKPDMSHVETFPDFYRAQETYVPVEWGLENLRSVVSEILLNYEEFQEIADKAQRTLRYFVEESKGRREFVEYAATLFRG